MNSGKNASDRWRPGYWLNRKEVDSLIIFAYDSTINRSQPNDDLAGFLKKRISLQP